MGLVKAGFTRGADYYYFFLIHFCAIDINFLYLIHFILIFAELRKKNQATIDQDLRI